MGEAVALTKAEIWLMIHKPWHVGWRVADRAEVSERLRLPGESTSVKVLQNYVPEQQEQSDS